MPNPKKKIRKRKRRFNLQTEEGRQLAMDNQKLFNVFPKPKDRLHYLVALIKDLDNMIGVI
jgi:hypothetical protein